MILAAIPVVVPQASEPPLERPGDIPFGLYKRQQARISRHRLYPVTVFYSTYAVITMFFALRTAHPWLALFSCALGLPLWTFEEYIFHRWVLHGHFGPGTGFIRKFAHDRLDPLHWDHHKHPFNGHHINGELKDLLPLFFTVTPLSFLAPIYTLPALIAGVVECYVLEEWIHHSCHFYNFRNPYFRYIKRHHFYHHSPKGENAGYGLTNGFWDIVWKTRFPKEVRESLYNKKAVSKKSPAPLAES